MIPETPEASEPSNGILTFAHNNHSPAKKFKYQPVIVEVKKRFTKEQSPSPDLFSDELANEKSIVEQPQTATPKNAFGPSLDSESYRNNIDELIAALVSQGGSIREPIVASQQNPVDIDVASISVDELIQMLKSQHDRIFSLLADAQQSA